MYSMFMYNIVLCIVVLYIYILSVHKKSIKYFVYVFIYHVNHFKSILVVLTIM